MGQTSTTGTATAQRDVPAGCADPAQEIRPEQSSIQDELVESELLVEDVSIDGMCGVY